VDPDRLHGAIRSIFESANDSKYAADWLSEAIDSLDAAQDPAIICAISISGIRLAYKLGLVDVANGLAARVESTIDSIDPRPERIDLLFGLADAMATEAPDQSLKYYDRSAKLRSQTPLYSRSLVDIIGTCLGLFLRVFRGLLRSGEDIDVFLERAYALCEMMPCTLSRCVFYCELVCKAWCEGRADVAKGIALRKCKPIIDSCTYENLFLKRRVYDTLFPAMYCAHSGSSWDILSGISKPDRGHAAYKVATMIITKSTPLEPVGDIDELKADIEYSDLVDIAELLDHVVEDYSFYNILKEACTIADQKSNRKRITAQQRMAFVQRVDEQIGIKLPDKDNIAHQGYVLISRAQILKLSEVKVEQWRLLVAQTSGISNIADRAVVLLEIANCLPSKMNAERKAWAEQARALVSSIPAAEDRYSRLEAYVKAIRSVDPAGAKSALRDAMALTFDSYNKRDASKHRRRLVDLAETIDPSFLDDLANMIDDDPARVEAKADLKRTVEIQKLRKSIASADQVDRSLFNSKTLPRAAWKNVSALNCGRIVTRVPSSLSIYLETAGGYTLEDAYPVLSWYIENCTRRFTTYQDVRTQIYPLTESLLLSTEIAAAIIAKRPKDDYVDLSAQPPSGTQRDVKANSPYVVRAGERAAALEYLRGWLKCAIGDEIVLCDPYFSQDDLEFLQLVLAERAGARVMILTSQKVYEQKKKSFTSDSFSAEWLANMDQDAPETEIVAIKGGSGNGILVHDRWLLAANGGLRFGTSFGSLGAQKLSEISVLDASEARTVRDELQQYFSRQRFVAGSKVSYMSVSL
jgi:hypothetical protein